ncbi:MAG TPA: IPT/TIG domain-containing protein, partial [Chryseolinea sp.]
MRILLLALLIFDFVLVSLSAEAQTLVQKDIGATTPLAWGDYDNDGDMDLLQHNGTALRILKNNLVGTTATFVDAGITLANVNPVSVGWVDINNDGYLDIYYTDGTLKLFINQLGSSFTPLAANISGETLSTLADWGDIDNDGDQDIIGSGLILRNLGSNKFEVSQRFTTNGRTEFLDFDNDGDLDFFNRDFLYTNKGQGLFELDKTISPYGSGANYQYGDLVLRGNSDTNVKLFAYQYSTMFSFQEIIIWDFEICGGGTPNHQLQYLKIADFDNDGKSDVLVRENGVVNLYTSTGGCNDVIAALAIPSGKTEVADFDKDGDLDVFVGSNVLENKTTTSNAAPSTPANLSSPGNTSPIKLSWSNSTDDKTPASSLTYNLIIKRGPDVVVTAGIGAAGKQVITERGNMGYNTSFDVYNLPIGKYTWTVQALDEALRPSALAPEQTFEVNNGPVLITTLPIPAQYSSTYDRVNDRYLLTYVKSGDLMGMWVDGTTMQPTAAEFKINTALSSANRHIAGFNSAKNEFMVSWLSDNGTTKSLYAKNLLASGSNLHSEKLIYTLTDTLKVFLGGDKIAVDTITGKYMIPFFQTRTDLSRPKTRFEDVEVTYYPFGLMDVFGLKISANATTITAETPKLLQTKSISSSFNSPYHRNFTIESAVEFDSKKKMYCVAWNFVGERYSGYGGGSSGEITSVLESDNLKLIVSDANLVTKSEASTGAGLPRNLKLLYNPLVEHMILVWSGWQEFTNGTGSNDYRYEVYYQIFSFSDNGAVEFKVEPTLVSKPPNIVNYGSGLPGLSWSRKRNEYLIVWNKGSASGERGVLGEGDIFWRRVSPISLGFIDADTRFLSNLTGNESIINYNSKLGHFLFGWRSNAANRLSSFRIPKDKPPLVKSISPIKAGAGTLITITGSRFGNAAAINKVMFGNKQATIEPTVPSAKDSTEIKVRVPSGFLREQVPVTVIYDDQPSNATVMFENLTLSGVTSVSPLVGSPGDVITILGSNFPTDKNNLQVMFGSVAATVDDIVSINAAATEIKVKVPQAAVRGKEQTVSVVIQDVANTYAGGTFRVIRTPVINDVELSDGADYYASCKFIQINGSNFSSDVNDLMIKIGTFEVTQADILSVTETVITLQIPLGVEGKNLPVTVSALDDGIGESTGTYDFFLGSSVKLAEYDNNDMASTDNSGEFKLKDGSDKVLTMAVYNACSVDEIKLWTKGISQPDSEWKSVTLTGLDNNEVDYTISGANVTADPLGLDVFYEVFDKSDSIRYSDTLKIFANFQDANVTAPLPNLTFGGDVSDYNIVSIPSVLSPNKINTVFKSILDTYGYDKSKWRIFHYKNENSTGANAEYVEYLDGLDDIDPGKGYWIIVRNEQEILFDLGNTPSTDGGPFEITLNNGWNQIGNPYNFDISWDYIMKFNEGNISATDLANIETYKTFEGGSFVTPDRIEKFRGGFVRYNGTVPLTLKIPFTQNLSGGRTNGEERKFAGKLDEKEWRLALDLSAGELNNKISSFGMHPRAAVDVDKMDEHKLPAFIQSLDLSFPGSLA